MALEPTDDLTDQQISDYCALYRSYPWWHDRTLDDVRKAIEHSDLIVGLVDTEAGNLVAAGRVLTDFVYYGKVYDVIVEESRRGNGIGRVVMDEIVTHPAIDSLDVLVLDCREGLVPFYEDCGFRRHELTASLEDHDEDLIPMKYEFNDGSS